MAQIKIDPSNIAAAEQAIPQDTPVCMVNLLRWNKQAQYPETHTLEPCTGQEAYLHRYIPAFNELAAAAGKIEVVFLGTPALGLVMPPDERWDFVAVIKYPSLAVFREVTECQKYKDTAEHHRLAALEDWRLICTVQMVV